MDGLLYRHLLRLVEVYKPSAEFMQSLKEDMFARPNKKGMFLTLNFLLPIFKQDIFKSTIRWPICTSKDEADFRGAVVKFLTEYNSKHKLFELPKLLPSILLSPGGTKLINFLLELTAAALLLNLRKKSKDAYEECVDFKTLDPKMQLQKLTDFSKDIGIQFEKDGNFISQSKDFEEKAGKKIQELESEFCIATDQLSQLVSETECFSTTDKKSFSDLENTSCVQKRMKELSIEENVIGVKIERSKKFKELIDQLFISVHRKTVLSKNKQMVLDGSNITPDELMHIANQLNKDNWLEDPESLFVDGKICLTGLMKFCDASAKKQLCLFQQMLSNNVNINGMSEQFENLLKQLRSQKKEASSLELELKEKLRALTKLIESIEEVLFNPEPSHRFETLLAPSPCITMQSLETEDEDDAEYEYVNDSPFMKKYVQKLLDQAKAIKSNVSTQSPVARPFNGRCNSFPYHSSPISTSTSMLNLVHRRNLCNLPSPLSCTNNGNDSSLNQMIISNDTCGPELNMSLTGPGHTSTPVLSENPGCTSMINSSNPKNLYEDSELDSYSPRGIFKLSINNNFEAEMNEEMKRRSDNVVPKTPLNRRESFLDLLERYKTIKLQSQIPVVED